MSADVDANAGTKKSDGTMMWLSWWCRRVASIVGRNNGAAPNTKETDVAVAGISSVEGFWTLLPLGIYDGVKLEQGPPGSPYALIFAWARRPHLDCDFNSFSAAIAYTLALLRSHRFKD